MELEQKLKQRLAELQAERDKFIKVAEKQVYGYDVAIGEVLHLLEPDPVTLPENQPAPDQSTIADPPTS